MPRRRVTPVTGSSVSRAPRPFGRKMDRAGLARMFRRVFGGDPPVCDELVELKGDVERRKEIREVFTGRTWWEIPTETIMEQDNAISFFAPKGMRYYLPSYLLSALDVQGDWVFPEMVVYGLYLPLKHPRGDPVRENFEAFLGLLTIEQKTAIRRYLEYVEEHGGKEGAQEALDIFWRKF